MSMPRDIEILKRLNAKYVPILGRNHVIPPHGCPFLRFVRGGFTGNNEMLAMFLSFLSGVGIVSLSQLPGMMSVWTLCSTGMIWIPSVQRRTCCGRVIKRQRLHGGMVPKATSYQGLAVRDGDIEKVRMCVSAEDLDLKVDYFLDSFPESGVQFFGCMKGFPGRWDGRFG
jgi:hypothetical protein